jgi:glutamyl-tRNA reductase
MSIFSVGLSYKRQMPRLEEGLVDTLAKTRLLEQTRTRVESLIVTSTCNRTEIYGFAEHPFQLIKLICETAR